MADDFEAGAKAAEEIARTAGKAIDASSGAGRFFARVFGPAFEEFGRQLEDTAQFRRAANLLKLRQRYEQIRAQFDVVDEPRVLPLNFGHALLEAASLEEADELQDLFAKLLFNSTDSRSQAETRIAFVSMLREMNGFDVRVLFAVARAPDANPRLYPTRTVYTAKLPDGFVPPDPNRPDRLEEPPLPVLVSLNNLQRLGCIVPAGVWDGAVSYGLVTFTPLGQALVAACTLGTNDTAGGASSSDDGADDDGYVDSHVG